MEIKTSEEIHNLYPKICYAGIDSKYSLWSDRTECLLLKNKEWISKNDLNIWIKTQCQMSDSIIELKELLKKED